MGIVRHAMRYAMHRKMKRSFQVVQNRVVQVIRHGSLLYTRLLNHFQLVLHTVELVRCSTCAIVGKLTIGVIFMQQSTALRHPRPPLIRERRHPSLTCCGLSAIPPTSCATAKSSSSIPYTHPMLCPPRLPVLYPLGDLAPHQKGVERR